MNTSQTETGETTPAPTRQEQEVQDLPARDAEDQDPGREDSDQNERPPSDELENPDAPAEEQEGSQAEEPEKEETRTDKEDGAREPNSQENNSGEALPEEIKMVISLKGGIGTVGLKKPDTDIFFESFQGLDIHLLLEEIPGVLRSARAQWEENPKYPSYDRPKTPPTGRRQNNRRRAVNNNGNNGNDTNTEPEAPAENVAPEAPREIQQALL